MIWKDRIKQYPHRYTLTNVSGTTYDFTEVTGEVIEAGTPVNAENLNKLAPTNNPTFTGTVTVPAPTNPTDAARLQDVTGLSAVYDIVIKTQAEFEALIADSTWFGAVSVAFVGQFTLSTPNNSGVKIPSTVKQIHGFNSAKITVTNFLYNGTTAKGGLWYDTAPTTNNYNISGIEIDCVSVTGVDYLDSFGFYNCINITNCIGRSTAGTSMPLGDGAGFGYCINIVNCYGWCSDGFGFRDCANIINCVGTGLGSAGCGFNNITRASNCKDGGSSTNMWGGTNKNIDLDTCCKTLVTADNSALNT